MGATLNTTVTVEYLGQEYTVNVEIFGRTDRDWRGVVLTLDEGGVLLGAHNNPELRAAVSAKLVADHYVVKGE